VVMARATAAVATVVRRRIMSSRGGGCVSTP
jgi:hypothetical protein